MRGAALATAAGAGSALSACSGAPTPTSVARPSVAPARFKAGDRPVPGRPAGVDMLPQIRHVVVVVMENHSFDNYFGLLGRGDGFRLDTAGQPVNANPGPDGAAVRCYHAPSPCQANVQVSQDWVTSHRSWDQGRNDGFVLAKGSSPMAYYTETDLPFYYSLGRTFVLCDRFFCSTMAQTYPNRRFLMAASAFGLVNDTFAGGDVSPRPHGFGTVFDMLNHYGVSWTNYYSTLPSSLIFPYVAQGNQSRLVPISRFYADAAAGTLPFFSLVDPDFGLSSEENPQDVQNGEQFAARVINAVLQSPAWPHTVLIWLYDEHGGYYDHVPPQPAVRPDGIPPDVPARYLYGDLYSWTGFRVPAVVASPWAKRDYVSSVVHDHTSILKLVETKWNLPALSDRDANASNLLDTLDLGAPQPPFLVPPSLAAPVAVTAAQVEACAASNHTA